MKKLSPLFIKNFYKTFMSIKLHINNNVNFVKYKNVYHNNLFCSPITYRSKQLQKIDDVFNSAVLWIIE